MTCTILDTVTGIRHEDPTWDYSPFWWLDGNGSCDCNREIFCDADAEDTGVCKGAHRYLIVAFKPGLDKHGNLEDLSEMNLKRLNVDYPEELLRKHNIV